MKKLFFSFLLITGFANAQTTSIVYFDSNKSELALNATKILDSLTAPLQTEGIYEIKISVTGHCDNTGTNDFNRILSESRAKTVADYLKSKIISEAKVIINAKGYGESSPVADNHNERGKAKNRRAEIVVDEVTRPLLSKDTSVPLPVPEEKKTFNDKSTLTDLEVGKTLVLKNLNFEGGTAVLLPEAKPTLEMLLKTMQNNPTLEIEIGGHVCCKDDMPLSILRAQSVYKYLVKNGINKERMTYKGHSRNKPIFENDLNEVHARANRRVEITVIKK